MLLTFATNFCYFTHISNVGMNLFRNGHENTMLSRIFYFVALFARAAKKTHWHSKYLYPVAYGIMAAAIESDVADPSAKYINPPKSQMGPPPKKPRVDHSKLRQGWVDGCSAALPRRDTGSGSSTRNDGPARGKSRGHGGSRPYWGKRGPSNPGRGRFRGCGWRGKWATASSRPSPTVDYRSTNKIVP